jgi:microcin C transport system substrate-binding protein
MEYYLDSNAMFEAFKGGKLDIRVESLIKNWIKGYNVPAAKDGRLIKEEIDHNLSAGTYGLFFNTRHPLFENPTIRKAISLAFDFFWLNKNLFYGQYQRNKSYYPNSDFEAEGPPSSQEIELLKPYKNKIPAETLTSAFEPPVYETEKSKHEGLEKAKEMLLSIGYVFRSGKLLHSKTGKPFLFEILLGDKANEKVVLGFVKSLEHIGITVKVRTVDSATYMNRLEHFDYDMILGVIPQSPSLGNEQRDFFASERADTIGTFNYAGIKNPVVDDLIENLIAAPTYNDLVLRAKVLDRVLLFNNYIIPAWHSNTTKIAFWNRLDKPKNPPKYASFYYLNWWMKPEYSEVNSQPSKPADGPKKPTKAWWDIFSWF